ncbi:UNVERIFIED_CONTAM: hypothetical protein Scaly_0478000 [Sesamum calycinum]|uniref:Uncharacterized protein n=1 Tax=Sesamum calycinum TaxID=2727403 RepID=A0AAW2SFI9_9LAMI
MIPPKLFAERLEDLTWCAELGIQQKFTSVAYPQANGSTPRSNTGETPFSLVYGSEAIISVEAELETFRIQYYEQENNDNLLRTNLDLIDEVREDVHAHIGSYKQRVVDAYSRRVRKREFQVADVVLRRAGTLGLVGDST